MTILWRSFPCSFVPFPKHWWCCCCNLSSDTAVMLHSLNHDEWAAVGQYLDPISLYQLSCTCMGLYKDISSNSALWRGQAVRRWPTLFDNSSADTVSDWYGCYRTVHKASCKVGKPVCSCMLKCCAARWPAAAVSCACAAAAVLCVPTLLLHLCPLRQWLGTNLGDLAFMHI